MRTNLPAVADGQACVAGISEPSGLYLRFEVDVVWHVLQNGLACAVWNRRRGERLIDGRSIF